MSSIATTVPATASSIRTGRCIGPSNAMDVWGKIWAFFGKYLAA